MKPALGSFPDNLAMIGSFSAAAQLYVVSSTTHTGSNGELSAWNKAIAMRFCNLACSMKLLSLTIAMRFCNRASRYEATLSSYCCEVL